MLTKTQPEPDLFSYAALSREDEAAAREDAALIKAHMKSAAESIIAVGLALKRQKERLPHGMFLPWIDAEFGLSERSAQRFMLRADRWSKSANLAGLTQTISASVLDEATDPSLPAEVRDRVESLLVDGQKVTVADIRKMKAEAKTAIDRADALAERNAELARKAPEPALIETIVERPHESEAKIRELEERIRQLSEANTQRAAENATLRDRLENRSSLQPAPPSIDAPNVIRPNFGLAEQEGDPDRFETGDLTTEDAIDAFSGSLGAMESLRIDPKEFWKRQGKKSAHGKRVHQALLNVNAIIGLLIKEHAK